MKMKRHRVQWQGRRLRCSWAQLVPILLVITISSPWVASLLAHEVGDDHLIPPPDRNPRYAGAPGIYDRICRQKLFVTKGDLARYLEQPDSGQTEVAVSMYRDVAKPGSLPGGYWLTITTPTTPLFDLVKHIDGQAPLSTPVSTRGVRIRRFDVPFPQAAAIAAHNAWIATLMRTKPLSNPQRYGVALEGSIDTFSALMPNGKIVEGQLPRIDLGHASATSRLLEIAHSLVNYCAASPAERLQTARGLETAAKDLIKKVSE
jgi:hypothetical protein